jgi:hypothetical protein
VTPPGLEPASSILENVDTNITNINNNSRNHDVDSDDEWLRLLSDFVSYFLFQRRNGSEPAASNAPDPLAGWYKPKPFAERPVRALTPPEKTYDAASEALRSIALHARPLFDLESCGGDSCSNVPAASITVADLLAALHARGTPEARLLRQALLAALVALDHEK